MPLFFAICFGCDLKIKRIFADENWALICDLYDGETPSIQAVSNPSLSANISKNKGNAIIFATDLTQKSAV